ncbi:MAG: hypothetical protein EBV03_01550, partial [Proteobacteria bacterium]|nr:hypothetical protein [Pseudomonadota bacterium]
QKNGKPAFEKILASSRRLSQVLWESLHPQYNTDQPEDRAALENALKQLSEKIADPTVRSHYLSYFKKLLWARPMLPAGGGKHIPKGAPRPEKPRSVHVEQLMIRQQHTNALDTLVQRLLNVVLKYPAFLQKSQVEETLSRIDVPSPRLDSLRCALIAAAGDAPLDNAEAFNSYVQAKLPGLPLDSLRLSYLENLSHDDALYLWSETLTAYEVMHLKLEKQELQDSLASTMSESALQRLNEVTEAIHKAETSRTFAPAETDIL